MRAKISDIAWLNKKSFNFSGIDTIQYIDTSSVAKGVFSEIKSLSLQNDTIPSRAKRAVSRNTILISTVRPNLEHYGFVDFEPDGVVVSTGFLTLDAKPDKVDARYLYYVITSPLVTKYLISIATTAVSSYPSFNPDDLGNFQIVIPDSIAVQAEIACQLSTIDCKISNNASICADLEAMAKLLYDYWFMQFDFPDENGKPYKSSGGKMVWNQELKREIPEGWEVHSLQDFIATSKNGDWGNETPKMKDDIQVRCFRGADFLSITSNYQTTAPIRFISKNSADRLLSDGDLVIEISGGSPVQSTGRIGYISQKFLDRCGGIMACSNFCKAFTPRKRLYQYWLYQTWKMYYDAGVMFNFEGKTTGIKNLMFDSVVRDIKVPTPPDSLLREYQQMTSMYYDKTQESFIESSELASLRDFLLPMLMNGQVKLGEQV